MNNIESYMPFEEYIKNPGAGLEVNLWKQSSNSIILDNVIIMKYPDEETSWNLEALIKFIANHTKAVVLDLTVSSVFSNMKSLLEMESDNLIELIPLPLRNFDYLEIVQYSAVIEVQKEISDKKKKFVILISACFEKWSLLTAGKISGLSEEEFERQLDRQTTVMRLGNISRLMSDAYKKVKEQMEGNME